MALDWRVYSIEGAYHENLYIIWTQDFLVLVLPHLDSWYSEGLWRQFSFRLHSRLHHKNSPMLRPTSFDLMVTISRVFLHLQSYLISPLVAMLSTQVLLASDTPRLNILNKPSSAHTNYAYDLAHGKVWDHMDKITRPRRRRSRGRLLIVSNNPLLNSPSIFRGLDCTFCWLSLLSALWILPLTLPWFYRDLTVAKMSLFPSYSRLAFRETCAFLSLVPNNGFRAWNHRPYELQVCSMQAPGCTNLNRPGMKDFSRLDKVYRYSMTLKFQLILEIERSLLGTYFVTQG